MTKFAGPATRPLAGAGPIVAVAPTVTYEGGPGWTLDPRGELFKLAVANMVGEATFYESAPDRDSRFVTLIHQVAATDPQWMLGFVPWLRTVGNMRSASVVATVECAKVGMPGARRLFVEALKRADEPAEALGYWLNRYGRKMPFRVKRGIAAAAVRLYTEQTALKWDSAGHTIRPGDVIDLTHPTPRDQAQSVLFHHLLDRRHNRPTDFELIEADLPGLARAYRFDAVPKGDRRKYLAQHALPALYTWERLSSWLPGGMDAAAWENAIPNMGYMALLRNLRNFDKAAVSNPTVGLVRARLTDPAEVARSKQFPFRFYSAYRALGDSVTYTSALEDAVTLSTGNIPALRGRTLILVDCSGSMSDLMSGRGSISRREAAGVFAGSVALRNRGRTDVWLFGTNAMQVEAPSSVLTFTRRLPGMGGTNTWAAYRAATAAGGSYDRLFLITDEQAHDAGPGSFPHPVYVWNLAGYAQSGVKAGPGVTVLGGLSDAAFGVVDLLDAGRDARWPWETATNVAPGAGDGDA